MIIIYGYSKLGAKIAKELQNEEREIIIIEPDGRLLDMAKKDGFGTTYYNYECYDDDDLIAAGINNIKLLVFYCLHNKFNKNLFVTLSARNLNQNLPIISLAANENDEKKLKLAGSTRILNPYELTALKVFRYLHRPMALKIIDEVLYGASDLSIEQISIKEGSKLDQEYLKDATLFSSYDLVVLGLQDTEITHEFIFASRGINHKIDSGDTIVVMGEKHNIKKFEEYING